jgi:hypothetical protein
MNQCIDEANSDPFGTLDELYIPTKEGETAIPGIVSEYERIFEGQEFPLLLRVSYNSSHGYRQIQCYQLRAHYF